MCLFVRLHRLFLPIETIKAGYPQIGDSKYHLDATPVSRRRPMHIGQWPPEAGARSKLRLDFMLYCGPRLSAPVPDETTHYRFRNPR